MYLNEKTIKSLEKSIGMSIYEINSLSLDEEIAYVEKKIGKPLKFPKNAKIDGMRIRTMEEVDKKLEKIIKHKDYMLEYNMIRLKMKNTLKSIKSKLMNGLSISGLYDAEELTDEDLFNADKVTKQLIEENKNKVLTMTRRNKNE